MRFGGGKTYHGAECTKIAHRRSLAIFTADRGIAGNSATRIIFYPVSSQKKSRFASDFLRRGNRASWGLKKSRDFSGSGENRRRNRRESRDFGALSHGVRPPKPVSEASESGIGLVCARFVQGK